MTVIERWTLNSVNGTRRSDGTLRDDIASVTGPKIEGAIDVVPADQLAGAVEALEKIASGGPELPISGRLAQSIAAEALRMLGIEPTPVRGR